MQPLVNNRFMSWPRAPAGVRAASAAESSVSVGMRFLLGQKGVIDLVGNADAAGLGEGFGVLLAQERAPYTDGRPAAERPVALHAGEHLAEHGVEKLRLEIDRGGVRLGLEVGGGLGSGGGGGIDLEAAGERSSGRRRQGRGGEDGVGDRHHITSMSAWMAPEVLIACRMAMRSRGPMPSELSPSTSCCSDTPSLTTASRLPSSETPTRVRGVTTVWPPANGCAWLTCGVSEMVTVRLPCATATVDTRTSRPMTMIPERSSMTTLAARSGSTCSCSISVSSATTLLAVFCGSVICTVEGSSGSAIGAPI